MKKILGAVMVLTLILIAVVAQAQAPRDPCVLSGALTTPAQDVRFFAVNVKNPHP